MWSKFLGAIHLTKISGKGVFKTRNGEMAKWLLTMWDTVNPYNYWELTTFKSVIFRLTEVIFRLTEALFRLTEALFRLTGVPFRHFAISCFKHALPEIPVQNQMEQNVSGNSFRKLWTTSGGCPFFWKFGNSGNFLFHLAFLPGSNRPQFL